MKQINLVLVVLIFGIFSSCMKDNSYDKVKIVKMTIYPEIAYGSSVLSDTFTELMIFSESDNTEKRQLSDIITDGFDFNYKIGSEFTFKAKKIWMNNPPLDVSSVRYEFIGQLKERKVLTENSEEILNIAISPNLVKFHPRFSENNGSDQYKVYDAMKCENESDLKIIIIRNIEGFDFEEGYSYLLQVKKLVTAEPYLEKYVLLKTIKKEKA